ncbi:MAG: sigma-70 family RNA polymerase sigma factor [Clostridiales bacterium]|nr:sigma-70 family RNA polymerase sigma factor [Clostridiales bacterium]
MEQDPRRAWLDEAITRWEKPLLRLCYAWLCDTALAEDAVQETFFKAWKNYGKFRGAAEEKTWLTRIAINTCKDQMKSAWARHTDRSVTPDALPEGSAPFDGRDDTVTRAVLSLPKEMKEAVLLHWYQGMSLDEIRRVLRLPRSTINYRLKKAKAILKKELEEWYFEEE